MPVQMDLVDKLALETTRADAERPVAGVSR
jgi:hypothetical protein